MYLRDSAFVDFIIWLQDGKAIEISGRKDMRYPMGYPTWDNTGPSLGWVFKHLNNISFKRYKFEFSMKYSIC